METVFEKDCQSKLKILDIGSGGQQSKIVSELSHISEVIEFDDEVGAGFLSDKTSGRREFFQCKVSACSSLKRPIKNVGDGFGFSNDYKECREVKSIKIVKTISLDDWLSNSSDLIDFIKIDVQGSEYDIIKGGSDFLTKKFPLVAVETWNIGVYENTRAFDEIISLMRSLDYQLLALDVAAEWGSEKPKTFKWRMRQTRGVDVGFDLLFCRSSVGQLPIRQAYILWYLGFQDLVTHLFPDSALVSSTKNKKSFSRICNFSKSIVKRLFSRKRYPEFPKLT